MDRVRILSVAEQLSYYQGIVDEIFGKDLCTINPSQGTTSQFLQAMAQNTHCESLEERFKELLTRLYARYQNSPEDQIKIRQKATGIASANNWAAAYGEIMAIDFLSQGIGELLKQPAKLDVTLPANRTFAERISGRNDANCDLYFSQFNVFADVKLFQDVAGDILRGIIKQVEDEEGDIYFRILAERDYVIGYDELKRNRSLILESLRRARIERKGFVEVDCCDGLAFRLCWDTSSILWARQQWDEYSVAEARHLDVFSYADKFVLDAPFILIFAAPPWVNGFLDSYKCRNTNLYRALARRVFFQYRSSEKLLSEIDDSYAGSDYVASVARHISGIFFLEDNFLMPREPKSSWFKCYCYFNPHMKNDVSDEFIEYIRRCKPEVMDGFESDNY